MNGGNSGVRMTGRPAGSPHVEPLLGAYVLGVLVPEEEARVAGHLTHCARCRTEYLGMADAQALRAACAEEDGLDGGPDGTGGTGGTGGIGEPGRTGGIGRTGGTGGIGRTGGTGWFGGFSAFGGFGGADRSCGGGGRTR
ncbi:zf-HC2 domain-containing protein [Streptomyces spongiicola]|uniref:anti-sigma factor family protein n=1 Tax=Streptomyces spongiicola TaxID=1690221 RepID=UPI0033E531A0